MAGRLVGMAVEGVGTWLLLLVGGVPMAALLGILTGLLAFLPNIGAIVSGVLIVLAGFSVGVNAGPVGDRRLFHRPDRRRLSDRPLCRQEDGRPRPGPGARRAAPVRRPVRDHGADARRSDRRDDQDRARAEVGRRRGRAEAEAEPMVEAEAATPTPQRPRRAEPPRKRRFSFRRNARPEPAYRGPVSAPPAARRRHADWRRAALLLELLLELLLQLLLLELLHLLLSLLRRAAAWPATIRTISDLEHQRVAGGEGRAAAAPAPCMCVPRRQPEHDSGRPRASAAAPRRSPGRRRRSLRRTAGRARSLSWMTGVGRRCST